MRAFHAQLESIARADEPVLVAGEPGTRPELAARAIHERSRRAAGPFRRVDAADLTVDQASEWLARAGEGTLCVAGLEPPATELAAFLARTLARRGDVRIVITATTEAARQLSRSLLDRLGPRLVVPPLRERGEDLPRLINDMVAATAARLRKSIQSVDGEAMSVLCAYRWPRNFDELQAVVERAVIAEPTTELTSASLPTDIYEVGNRLDLRSLAQLGYREFLAKARDQLTREYLIELMRAHGGSVTRAATHAGIERESLHRLLKRHRVRADDYRP